MARVTVRTSTVPLSGSLDDLFPNGQLLIEGWGRRAVAEVQTGLWADRNFRRVTGKSRLAWRFVKHPKGLGLDLVNDATNRYGTPYARYVHYAGTPKSATVVGKVQVMLERDIQPELIKALGRDFKAGLKKRKKTVKTTTFGGG